MNRENNHTGALALAKLFASFLDSHTGKRSDYTLTGYRTSMRLFAIFAEQRLGANPQRFDITYFTEQNVCRYLEWLQDKHNSTPQTCNLRLCQLRAFLKYASRDPAVMPYYLSLKKIERYITENRVKIVEPLPKCAIEALINTPGVDTTTGLRYTLLIAMLYTMALRMDEVLSIKIKDMTLDTAKPYVIVVGKGRKARTAYFMKAVLKTLRTYIVREHGKNPNPDAYLFYSRSGGIFRKSSSRGVNKQLKVYAAQARKSCSGVPDNVHSHQFRHSMATHLLEDGMNVFQISKMLGHENVETTMDYLGVTVSMTETAIKKIESTTAQNVKPAWPKTINNLKDLF